jgi:hypothetical protein
MATLEQFAKITRKVVAEDGFDDYLPTALYPERKHIVVLEGAPEGVDLEPIAIRWADQGAISGEEYLVAFKVGPKQFKIVRRYPGGQEEGVFDVADDV